MRVLLVQPDCVTSKKSLVPGFDESNVLEPLGLEYLAAYLLDHGHEVDILDMRIDGNLTKAIKKFKPEIIGTSCNYTTNVNLIKDLITEIKKFDSGIKVVVGGHVATFLAHEFLSESEVDFVVRGDGELAFQELVGVLVKGGEVSQVKNISFVKDGKEIHNPVRDLMPLEELKAPARHLVDKYRKKYSSFYWRSVGTIDTTRGCPYNCNFCSVWKFSQQKYRVKSPEKVVNELEQMPEKYIVFCDNNFLENTTRAEKIYQLIKEKGIQKKYYFIARSDTIARNPDLIRKWREIGLLEVFVGFEAISSEALNKMNKRNTIENNEKATKILADNGIITFGSFIILPEFEENDFKALLNYVKKLDKENSHLFYPMFSILTPLPGSDLYQEQKNKITTKNYDLYNNVNIILPTKLPKKKFEKLYVKLYSKTYNLLKLARMHLNKAFVPSTLSFIQFSFKHGLPWFLWKFKKPQTCLFIALVIAGFVLVYLL
ncbi:MAG TPA: radical SAM protein [Candidatus Nanoarchaeia archaeon]|nr:radical SAM protein [Candidatus Nanoarchaeia archaeon]